MSLSLRKCCTAPVLFRCKITVQFRLPYCPLNSIHVAKKIFILKINFKKENNYDYIFFLEIISQIFFSKFWVGGQKISFSTMCLDYKIYHFFLLILTLSLRYPFLLFLFIFFSGHRGGINFEILIQKNPRRIMPIILFDWNLKNKFTLKEQF